MAGSGVLIAVGSPRRDGNSAALAGKAAAGEIRKEPAVLRAAHELGKAVAGA